MRCIKATLRSSAAACALALVAAAPAMASEFTASRLPRPLSESEPGKTKGVGVGSTELGGEERNQEFRFGGLHIYCAAKTSAKLVSEGAVSWTTSPVFATEVKFEKCLTKATYGGIVTGTKTGFNFAPGTSKTEPLKFVYHVNGFAQFGDGEVESEVEVGSGDASFKIAGKVCKVVWPHQTVPAKAIKAPEEAFSAAKYSSTEVPVLSTQLKKFPSGFQQRLIIDNEFLHMEWHFEEGQCLGEGGFEQGAAQEEGRTGIYKGSFEEEVVGGNLGFNP